MDCEWPQAVHNKLQSHFESRVTLVQQKLLRFEKCTSPSVKYHRCTVLLTIPQMKGGIITALTFVDLHRDCAKRVVDLHVEKFHTQ